MSETQGYEVGQVENGRRWNGHDWETVEAEAAEGVVAAEPGSEPAQPVTGEPAGASTLLGDPQYGGPAYGDPLAAGAATGGPSPFAAAAPLFLLGVLVAVGVSIAGIMVINSRGGGILWWGGYFVTFGLWRAAFARYKEASAASGTGLGGLGTAVVTAVGSGRRRRRGSRVRPRVRRGQVRAGARRDRGLVLHGRRGQGVRGGMRLHRCHVRRAQGGHR